MSFTTNPLLSVEFLFHCNVFVRLLKIPIYILMRHKLPMFLNLSLNAITVKLQRVSVEKQTLLAESLVFDLFLVCLGLGIVTLHCGGSCHNAVVML